MRDFSDELSLLRKRLSELAHALDVDGKRSRLGELETRASDPSLWEDQEAARAVTTELSRVKGDVDLVDGLDRRLSDAEVLFQLAREESDDSLGPELEQAIGALEKELDELEL